MSIGQIIAQNITDLLSTSNEQLKSVHARAAEAGLHINYPMLAKLGSIKSEAPKNPSVETLDKVVDVLRMIPGQEKLQPWMLLCEGYFRDKKPVESQQASEQFMVEYLDEFLFAITTMKILPLDGDTYEKLKNVGTFCYKNKLKLNTKSPESNVKTG